MSASSSREVARGTGLILFGALIQQGTEYLFRFAMARGLGVEGFGTLSQARAVFFVVLTVAMLGLGGGVKRFVAGLREKGEEARARRVIRETSLLVLGSTLLGVAFLWFLAEPVSQAFRNPTLSLPLGIFALGLPAAGCLWFLSFLAESFRSFRVSVVALQILTPAIRLVSSVLLVGMGGGLVAVAVANGGSYLVGFLVALFLVLRLPPLRSLAGGPAPSSLAALFRFSLPLMAGGVLFDFAERVDILMLGLFLDERHVGIYAAGSAVARALLLLIGSTLPVLTTLAAEASARRDLSEVGALHRTAVRWMLVFVSPLVAGCFLYASEVISLLFGREYAAAAPTARLLIVAYSCVIFNGPAGALLDSLGKSHLTMINMVARLTLNVALNLLLIPRYGITGAAGATLCALLLANVLLRIQLGRLVPLAGNYAGWLRPLLVLALATVLSAVVARNLRLPLADADLISALVGGLVLVAAFALGMRLVPGCLRPGDLALLGLLRDRLRPPA